MRYEWPATPKWEGTLFVHEDVLLVLEVAIKTLEGAKMAKGKKREAINALKAAMTEIGHLRWTVKENHNK